MKQVLKFDIAKLEELQKYILVSRLERVDSGNTVHNVLLFLEKFAYSYDIKQFGITVFQENIVSFVPEGKQNVREWRLISLIELQRLINERNKYNQLLN